MPPEFICNNAKQWLAMDMNSNGMVDNCLGLDTSRNSPHKWIPFSRRYISSSNIGMPKSVQVLLRFISGNVP